MNNFDLCRDNLHKRLNIQAHDKRDPDQVSAEIRRMTKKLDDIASLARPRLIMGGIRYGSNWDHDGLMQYMQTKFDAYKKTGNFEMLVDLFNFIAIEGVLKTHPQHHFKGEDRK